MYRALRGGPGGPRGDPRGGPPGSVDSDRWARGVPLPPARGGGGQMGGPGMRGGAVPGLPALHKTESAFKAGLKLTDDPEEEEKQRTQQQPRWLAGRPGRQQQQCWSQQQSGVV